MLVKVELIVAPSADFRRNIEALNAERELFFPLQLGVRVTGFRPQMSLEQM